MTPSTRVGLLLGVFLLTACATTAETPAPPRAEQGTLDLTGWSWDRGSASLDGEWTLDGQPWPVPSSQGFHGKSVGTGTYRLRVRLPHGAESLVPGLPILGTAFRLSVGGVELAKEGAVTPTADGAVPSYRPRIVLLPRPADGLLDLEIAVSNWDDQFGGIDYGLTLGPRGRPSTTGPHGGRL